jgi:glycosyltransferase involved in cell wall biosynthesis
VQAAYDDSDLFLFTSLRDTEGVQLLEAMGRGLPVVTLDHQGAATLVPDSVGIKVPVTTPKQTPERLARAIEKLAADHALLASMGEAAIEVARRHTWERKASEVLKIYRQLTENAGHVHAPAALSRSPRLAPPREGIDT